MIGLFDSGYGGITVLKPFLERFPQYDYIYFGDNARAPYGNHSAETILQFTEQAVNHLFDRGVKLVIIACNTASANALSSLQKKYLNGADEKNRKILGVLIPTVEKAAAITKTGRIGLVGTKATVNSGVYNQEIAKINPDIHITSKACPLLVPFIEEGWHTKPEATSILKKYLRSLKNANIDTLILGCTHYPIMRKQFQRIIGKRVQIIESGQSAAESLESYLLRHPEIAEKLTTGGTRKFLTTEDPATFQSYIQKNFALKIAMPAKVSLRAGNAEKG